MGVGLRLIKSWSRSSPRTVTMRVLAVVSAVGVIALLVVRPGSQTVLQVLAATAVAWAILLAAWSGGSPTDAYKRAAERMRRVAWAVQVERRLIGLLGPHKPIVAGGMAITIGITLVGLAKPWPTKILVDDVFGDGSLAGLGTQGAIVVAVVLTASLFALGGGLAVLQTRVLYSLTQRIIRDLRAQLFGHLTKLSLRFHDEHGVGDNAYRISADTYSLHTLLLSGVVPFTAAVLTLGGTVIVMMTLDPLLAVLSLVSLPAAAILTHRYGRLIRRSSVDVHERESEVYTHAEQTLAGIRTVQAFGREPYELQRFTDRANRSSSSMLRLVTQQTVFGLTIDAALGAGLAVVMYVAAQRTLDGVISVGELLVFLAYAASLYDPVSSMAGVFAELQSAAAGAQRVFEVLDRPQPPEKPGALAPTEPMRGHVRIEEVSFSYLPGHEVLHEVSLDVPAGATVALVGPTGAGKTTLVSLLLRLYDPDAGRVTRDGHDLRDLPVRWLREQTAFVPQEPLLFPGTIRDNIRYGHLDSTDAQVEEAARQANILAELQDHPGGLDALVGERGMTLSGGQRQRVAIARALLKNTSVVVLDEPTSALDAQTESLVMQALQRLTAGRTSFVIAHRLVTVEHADVVVVMDGGRIVQRGTHRGLIRRRGLYRKLHESRFGAAQTST